jgi:hypothetical protein
VGGSDTILAQGGQLSSLSQIAVVPSALPEAGRAALLALGLGLALAPRWRGRSDASPPGAPRRSHEI